MNDAVGPGEAARRLGVSTRTVQRWLRDGRLPSVKVGAHVKVLRAALPPAANEAPAGVGRRRIERLLVANRGELVVRIARTCRARGVRCLALVADDQVRAWWTRAADELVPLRGSYLDVDAVIAAARAARADAVHPGYGFLAESAEFGAAVIDAGMAWVGPPPAAMRALGDKAAARQVAASVGVPVLPGYDGDEQDDGRLAREAARIGFPLLVKPSAGGGGKGMHVVRTGDDLGDSLARARREARAAFGDDRLVLERYLPRARHVEVQLMCDAHGGAVHLGERECSLQRRHQKVIEEAPSPAVDEMLRERLGDAALRLARSAGYVGAGTAEFLLAEDGTFYFLELNARLQVEHPVTELVTGRDLVADQLSIAAGERLAYGQSDVTIDGHAVEARLYAEDPRADFLPAAGDVVEARWPHGDGMRVDAGAGAGDVIGTRYDPLLAKLIARGDTRDEALARLATMLAGTSVIGVTTNRGFLSWLVALPAVRQGQTYTRLIDDEWRSDDATTDGDWLAAAAALGAHVAARAPRAGFRLNAPPRLSVDIDGIQRTVAIPPDAHAAPYAALDETSIAVDLDGRSAVVRLAQPPTVESAVRAASHEGVPAATVSAPMPGTILAVRVSDGDEVVGGQTVIVLEAMKMEHNVAAPAAGRIARVAVSTGQQVQRGETLVELA